MTLRGFKPAALAAACAIGFATPSQPAPPSPWVPPAPRARAAPAESAAAASHDHRAVRWINDEPDTGQFLPDTVLLARVADREIRVGRYIDVFFLSYAEYRPRPDSAGRLEFLNSMINKEVLGLTALAINRPLGFEDRAKMREHTQRVLSNVLYQREVLDSVIVTEEEIRQLYEQFRFALHLRHIQFADHATAERVRRDLIAGRIAWKDAVRKHSTAADAGRDGDLGWRNRMGFDPYLAQLVFTLKPGEFSVVVQDADGYQVIQAVERRPENAPAYTDVRSSLRDEIRRNKTALRAEAVQAKLRAEIGMTYDTTNITWASAKFTPTMTHIREGNATTVEFNPNTPDFSPGDTSRVLTRYRGGQLTLGGFLDGYLQIQPLLRPSVNDFDGMRTYMDGVVLEPSMAELAVQHGLARDSLAIYQIESRREEILVDHMYEDSITSKVWIRPEERRKYYQDHLAGFMTYPRITYAGITRRSRAAADSVAARLRAGEKAQDVVRADSLLGRTTGSIQERSANDHGTPYYKLLFEELRPGQVVVEGPDKEGTFAAIQLLTFDPGRQLRYEEVEHIIDESLHNLKAEEMLKAFLKRHKKRFRIETHPELLHRVRMVDRSLLE